MGVLFRSLGTKGGGGSRRRHGETRDPFILHMQTPSPVTPLGSKGAGEGNCMSTPVCIANAVADALGLKDITLPLVPAKLADAVRGEERAAPPGRRGRGAHKKARATRHARRG